MKYLVVGILLALVVLLSQELYIVVSTGNGGLVLNFGRPIVVQADGKPIIVLGGEVVHIPENSTVGG